VRAIEKRPPGGEGFWERSAHPVFLLLPVPVIGGVAYWQHAETQLALALVTLAATLFFLSVIGLVARYQARARARMLREAVPHLISRDATPAYFADENGVITFANDAAEERFPNAPDDKIASRFATVFANPDAVLYRLQARAVTMASAREDVVTRNGHFRVSVARIGRNMYLWRFDDLVRPDKASQRQSSVAQLPMLTAGRSGAVLFLNDAFRRHLEKRPKTLADVFGPEPLVSGQFRQFKTGSGTLDCVIALFDGVAGRQEVYAIPMADGGPVGPTASVAGSDGWQAIDELPVPLMKIAGDGEILASNREARELLSLEQTNGLVMSEVLDGLGRPVNDWIKEALEDRSAPSAQFLRGRGEHQNIFVQVTLKVAQNRDDAPHLIAVLSDVTELKTLEANFVQSQKMHAIGQLAGGVAHDFNNLLTAIAGHCDLLLLRHDQGDQNYSDLVQIHQNANRAASLVGQLLAFSRKQNLQPEVVDVRDALSELTHLLNRLVGEKVRLKLTHDPNLAPIKADKRQLEQVIMNLVVNARDAMPNGGEIKVSSANLTLEHEVERDHAFIPAGDYVEVRVSDEGHGIAPERLPMIFEPFYTTKRTGEGTGLGLSTAYGIVKQTGGYIFAASEVGKGTEFTLLFPHHDMPLVQEPARKTRPLPVADPSLVDGIVLLVEDEAPVRAFASRALRLRGYTVLEADCAEAALSMLADPEVNVDIFVTDVIMPGKDGPTWVREALVERPETKVVFVSGYSEDAFVDGKEKIPNSVFLPKPFSLNDLTSTVQTQLQ